MVEIQNYVLSYHLNQRFDLNELKTKFPETDYDSERFHGAILRLQNPKACLLL